MKRNVMMCANVLLVRSSFILFRFAFFFFLKLNLIKLRFELNYDSTDRYLILYTIANYFKARIVCRTFVHK